MLNALFLCAGCGQSPAERESFPLCGPCLGGLRLAPGLCERCGGLGCAPGACARAWMGAGPIRASQSKYLLVGGTYPVLRAWKHRRGPVFDRRVLALTPELKRRLSDWRVDAIIPVPQRFERSWRLGGSPAAAIARSVSRELGGVRILSAFAPLEASEARQSQRGLFERAGARFPWSIAQPGLLPGRVLVVDDFRTTGRTLRKTAEVLQRARPDIHIYSYALGIRPAFSHRFDIAACDGFSRF